MLEPPVMDAETIIACLKADYGLSITNIVFLPLGADPDTAVYRAVASDTTPYFVKLRRGVFPAATVAIPHWLAQNEMQHVIAPLTTQSGGALWTQLDSFTLALYPFVAGHSAYARHLSTISGWSLVWPCTNFTPLLYRQPLFASCRTKHIRTIGAIVFQHFKNRPLKPRLLIRAQANWPGFCKRDTQPSTISSPAPSNLHGFWQSNHLNTACVTAIFTPGIFWLIPLVGCFWLIGTR